MWDLSTLKNLPSLLLHLDMDEASACLCSHSLWVKLKSLKPKGR